MRAASASITCSAWRGCGSCRTAARRATARYPLDDLLRIVALEAARHRAIAIGEDLGTVPAGFRERIAAQGIAGMRVLWFERDADGAFRPPSDWDRDTVAMTSTHDLPTVAGWWRGVDLEWRRGAHAQRDDGPAHGAGDDVGLAAAAHGADGADGDERNAPCLRDDADDAGRDPSPPDPDLAAAAASAETERAAERTALWRALQRAGCAPADQAMRRPLPPVDAVVAYVARSPSPLAIVPLEDLLGLDAQPNLPARRAAIRTGCGGCRARSTRCSTRRCASASPRSNAHALRREDA
jgi:4-alpha-glucanotransferase